MSRHDYIESRVIAEQDHGFYALIMAAMRKADTVNSFRLKEAFPDTWTELHDRYNAPGGLARGRAVTLYCTNGSTLDNMRRQYVTYN